MNNGSYVKQLSIGLSIFFRINQEILSRIMLPSMQLWQFTESPIRLNGNVVGHFLSLVHRAEYHIRFDIELSAVLINPIDDDSSKSNLGDT